MHGNGPTRARCAHFLCQHHGHEGHGVNDVAAGLVDARATLEVGVQVRDAGGVARKFSILSEKKRERALTLKRAWGMGEAAAEEQDRFY